MNVTITGRHGSMTLTVVTVTEEVIVTTTPCGARVTWGRTNWMIQGTALVARSLADRQTQVVNPS